MFIIKGLYNLVVIGIWLILVWQFANQVALSFIVFFHDKINQSFAHMFLAVILAVACHFLVKLIIPIKQ